MTGLQRDISDEDSAAFTRGNENKAQNRLELTSLSAGAILEVALSARRLVEALYPMVNELLSNNPILQETVAVHDALDEIDPLLSQLAELAGWPKWTSTSKEG